MIEGINLLERDLLGDNPRMRLLEKEVSSEMLDTFAALVSRIC